MVPHRQNYDQGGRITTWEPTRKQNYDLCLRLLERRLLPCDNLCRCIHSGAIDIANINQLEYNWQHPWTSNVTREAHVCMYVCTYSNQEKTYLLDVCMSPTTSHKTCALSKVVATNLSCVIVSSGVSSDSSGRLDDG